MGLFGGRRNPLGNIDQSRFAAAGALLNGDYGAAAGIFQNRSRLRAAEREAETERAQAQAQREALLRITDRDGRPLFTKDQVAGMRPEDVSQLAREYAQPRQFSAQGGSVYDPRDGQFTQAPWREQVGPDIVGQQPGGPIETLRRGVSPVSVDGVGVFGMTSDGQIVGSQGIQQNPGIQNAPMPQGFGFGGPMAGPQGAPQIGQQQSLAPTQQDNQLEQWAQDAIRRGADPAAVARRLLEMRQGGAGQPGPQTFPGQWR